MKQTIYVGTYTRGKRDKGIFIYDFDDETGKLKQRDAVGGVDDPSFLAVSPDRRCLLAASEGSVFDGKEGGGVCSFAVDPDTGDLTRLTGEATYGEHPCYVSFDASGQWAFAANYGAGSLAMMQVKIDGSVGPTTAVVRHHGRSVSETRQTSPHVHCVRVDPQGRHLFVADLGLDQIIAYPLELSGGRLDTSAPVITRARPGAGPRHLEFHPNGRYLYVSNELDSTVVAYALDAESGHLTHLQTLSTLPDGHKGENDVADIHFDPSGRYLYVSNRGDDSLAAFAVDADLGTMIPLGHTSVRGHWPRNFGFDLSGRYVLVANQKSNDIQLFRFNDDGSLKATGESVDVKEPVCVIAAVF